MKVINYFAISSIMLCSINLQASWTTQIKKYASAGFQRLKSNFRTSDLFTQQKRALYTPHCLKGTIAIFNTDFKHFSPALGVATLPIIERIAKYSGPGQALTRLIQDPRIALLHANPQDGRLHPTRNISSPVSSWTPEMVAKIVVNLHLGRLQNDDVIKKEIVTLNKKLHREQFDSKLSTNRIEEILQTLAQTTDESTETPNRKALYPTYYPYAILSLFLWLKATSREDIDAYLKAIEKEMKLHGAVSPFKNPDLLSAADTERAMFKDVNLEDAFQQPVNRIILSDDNAFEIKLASEIYALQNGVSLPQEVINQTLPYKTGAPRPICAETALRDLCNLILAGEDKKMNISILPEHIQPLEGFKEFYMKHSSYSAINDINVAQDWFNLLSDHKEIKYDSSLNSFTLKKVYEVQSTLDNLLCVLNLLFGTTAQTYTEFAQKLSSDKRQITAEVIQKDEQVKFIINYGTLITEAHLYVNKGKHTWLEVPMRTLENRELSTEDKTWFTHVTDIIHDEHTTAPVMKNAELILTQRPHVLANQNNTKTLLMPKTIAQASHFSYATENGAKKPYCSYWKDLIANKNPEEIKTILKTIIAAEKSKNNSCVLTDIILWAAENNDPLAQKILLNFLLHDVGIDINIKNREGFTPLILAAKKNTEATCKVLLEYGADVNAHNNLDDTALTWAATHKSNIYTLLIDRGANVNARNSEGYTPLILAAKQNNYDMCKDLLSYGADVNAKNNLHDTALTWAVTYDSEIYTLLIDHGADINVKNSRGNTPLILAINNYNRCKRLLEAGAEVNASNDQNETALTWAIYRKNRTLCKLLLKHGARTTNIGTCNNLNPLIYAFTQSFKMWSLLLKYRVKEYFNSH